MARVIGSADVLKFVGEKNVIGDKAQGLVDSGVIKAVDAEVTIGESKSWDKQEHYAPYKKYEATNFAGALALCGNSEKDLVTYVNSALDAELRANIRQKLAAEAEGPEKRLISAAKAIAKTGLADFETALASLKAQYQKPVVA